MRHGEEPTGSEAEDAVEGLEEDGGVVEAGPEQGAEPDAETVEGAPAPAEEDTSHEPTEQEDVAGAAADDAPPIEIVPELTPLQIEINARKALQAQLSNTQQRLRTVSKAYQDMEKDMASFRTRTEAAMQARADRRAVELAEKLFEPVQNLKRSLSAGGDPELVVEGLTMILKQFEDALKSFGLEEVPGEGFPFDPTVHEALAVMPVLDEAQDGKVVMVHNTGYRIGSRVLQPAQVVIGKYEKPAEA